MTAKRRWRYAAVQDSAGETAVVTQTIDIGRDVQQKGYWWDTKV